MRFVSRFKGCKQPIEFIGDSRQNLIPEKYLFKCAVLE